MSSGTDGTKTAGNLGWEKYVKHNYSNEKIFKFNHP